MKTIEEQAFEWKRNFTELLSIEDTFIAGAQAVQKWISMNDELPKNSDELKYYLVKCNFFDNEYIHLAKSYKNNQFWSIYFPNFNFENVTYWRPIEYN